MNGPADTKGQVTQQDPIAETQVEVNSSVTITVNKGPETGTIPDGLVGKDRKSAEDRLNDAGFDSVDAKAASSEPNDAKAGEVLSVSPKEGSTVALSTKVTLTYATGESTVPNLVGVNRERAEADAKSAGFKVRFTEQETDDQPPGLVMSQDPDSGSMLARGETISVVVAVAPSDDPDARNRPADAHRRRRPTYALRPPTPRHRRRAPRLRRRRYAIPTTSVRGCTPVVRSDHGRLPTPTRGRRLHSDRGRYRSWCRGDGKTHCRG